jgi:hypothetical protein
LTFVRFTHDKNLEGVFPSPVPAIKKAPDFYKAIRPQHGSHPDTSTVKRCVPYMDALSAGFVIPLWADLYVAANNGDISFSFPRNFPMALSMDQHGYTQFPDHPLSNRPYGKNLLKFINPWVVETAPGYSCLFTAPLNHLETKFKILDGAVDTDNYYSNVHIPFLWTGGDGEFFIPKGTPLVQIIPYRRETFTLEVDVTNFDRRTNIRSLLGTHIKDGYRKEFWSKAKTLDDEYEEEMGAPTPTT